MASCRLSMTDGTSRTSTRPPARVSPPPFRSFTHQSSNHAERIEPHSWDDSIPQSMSMTASSRRPSASFDADVSTGNQKRQASVYDAVAGITLNTKEGLGELLRTYRARLLNWLHSNDSLRIQE